MWIAFKNYYLRDEGQLERGNEIKQRCCELLSKIIIFVMKDNAADKIDMSEIVVNCFQKLLSSWWRTTCLIEFFNGCMLWIAFKNYYLRDEGQLPLKIIDYTFCCELLSKIIIFVMKDNDAVPFKLVFSVVNCFQKLLSSWWRTTRRTIRHIPPMLWIAFKNYYLRDEGQRLLEISKYCECCELLSKIIIFVMKDNRL